MSDDPTQTVIDVHIDTLEYTRQGLKTRDPIDLTVGRHNKVRLLRPKRLSPLRTANSGFPHDSAFPLPGTLCIAWSTRPGRSCFAHSDTRGSATVDFAFQVFGHTSASGDDEGNKTLSERRARAGLALLRSDGDLLAAVAQEDGWGLQHAQAMLRTLTVNPGPCDGDLGTLTEAAMLEFVSRYHRNVFHRTAPGPPKYPDLPDDAGWGDAMMLAIIDAFAAAHGAGVEGSSIVRHAGCSEFNPLASDSPGHNRRLSVVASSSVPPYPDSAPCTDGDTASCALVDEHTQRCLWYREHVADPPPPDVELFDARWLWIEGDRYVLSALTTASDEQTFEFEVFDASGGGRASTAVLPDVRPILGTVSVVWRSKLSPADEHGRPPFEGKPTFEVRASGTQVALEAPWRARTTARVLVGASASRPHQGSEVFKLYASDGSYASFVALSAAEPISPQKVAVVFEGVPEGILVNLAFGVNGAANYDLFRDVLVDAMLDNCSIGNECKEVPALSPPKIPADGLPDHFDRLPEVEDEDETAVRPPW